MVRHLTQHQYDADYAARPAVDDRHPAIVIPAAVAKVLELADTWLGWDGRPIYRDNNAWTPHKALRRVTDHLLDHRRRSNAVWPARRRCPTSGTGG